MMKKNFVFIIVCTLVLMTVLSSCGGKEAKVDERLLSFNSNIDEKTKLSLNNGIQSEVVSEEKGGFVINIEQVLTVQNGMGIAGKIVVPEEIYDEAVKNDDMMIFTECNLKIDGKDFDLTGRRSGSRSEWEAVGENVISFVVAFHGENTTFDKGETIALELTELNGRFAEYEDIIPVTISWELENVLSDIVYEHPEGGDEWYVQ